MMYADDECTLQFFHLLFQSINKHLYYMYYFPKKIFLNNFLLALNRKLLQLNSLCICPHLWVYVSEFSILANRCWQALHFKTLPDRPRLIK